MTATAKLDLLVHYICAVCENPAQLGVTKLNKILWYSDVAHYERTGKSITSASYVKRQFGPVPRDIMATRERLRNAGKIFERPAQLGRFSQTQLISLTEPDISAFTAEEISLVDAVTQEICGNHTASSISQLSHDAVWEVAAIGEEIPMFAAAFGGNVGEIDEDDIAWANAEVHKIKAR